MSVETTQRRSPHDAGRGTSASWPRCRSRIGSPTAFVSTARTTRDRAEATARLAATVNQRAHRLAAAIRQGAPEDATLASVRADLEGQRRREIVGLARLIAGGDVDPGRVDELWVQSADQVYVLLTEECGWSRARYESWLTDRIVEILDRPV